MYGIVQLWSDVRRKRVFLPKLAKLVWSGSLLCKATIQSLGSSKTTALFQRYTYTYGGIYGVESSDIYLSHCILQESTRDFHLCFSFGVRQIISRFRYLEFVNLTECFSNLEASLVVRQSIHSYTAAAGWH